MLSQPPLAVAVSSPYDVVVVNYPYLTVDVGEDGSNGGQSNSDEFPCETANGASGECMGEAVDTGDRLRTSLCVQFESHHVAAGAIFLAAKFLKVKLPSDGEVVWWQEFDVTPRQLEEVSNQMLELYEQNKAPLNLGSEAEVSVAGGGANRAVLKTSTEDHIPSSNSSQVGAIEKAGSLKPPTSHQLPDYSNKHGGPPRSSQGKSSDYSSLDPKPHGEQRASEPLPQPESLGEMQIVRADPEWNSVEDSKEGTVGGNKIREMGESKDNNHGSNIEFKEAVSIQSPSEMIEKIDANKLKELREKRKKSRGVLIRKKDSVDEFDPIVKELEEGVELAAAENEKSKLEKRLKWSQMSARLDSVSKHPETSGDRHHVGSKSQQSRSLDLENTEEGEMPTLDDPNKDYHSPKSNSRKRKAGSPGDKTGDGKRWRDSIPGELPEENSRMARVGYPDRDHKRHVQENHA
ncbi:hypothetical protein KSS87_022616 [Heliosperma pusillum]|nr:hypothetical protein KSS87_022616 [Heliosperma pusillum]